MALRDLFICDVCEDVWSVPLGQEPGYCPGCLWDLGVRVAVFSDAGADVIAGQRAEKDPVALIGQRGWDRAVTALHQAREV